MAHATVASEASCALDDAGDVDLLRHKKARRGSRHGGLSNCRLTPENVLLVAATTPLDEGKKVTS